MIWGHPHTAYVSIELKSIRGAKPPESKDVYEGPCRLSTSQRSFKTSGRLELEWDPAPRLRFKALVDSANPDWPDRIQFEFTDLNIQGTVFVEQASTDWRPPSDSRTSLAGFVEASNPSAELGPVWERVNFLLPNFHLPYLKSPQAFKCDASGWTIQIEPGVRLEDRHELRQGGWDYQFTHSGELRKADGTPFTAAEGRNTLTTLGHFLTFIRGLSCRPVLPVARQSDGTEQLLELAIPGTGEWTEDCWVEDPTESRNEHAWEDAVSQCAPGFWALKRDYPHLALMIPYWYTQAKNGRHVLNGIVVAQLVLESLMSILDDDGVLSLKTAKGDKRPKEDVLSDALERAGIRKDIPDLAMSEPTVRAFVDDRDNNVRTGPELVVRVRNKTVHADLNPRSSVNELISDGKGLEWVRQLAVNYVELLLLHRFGFKGTVWSRVEQENEQVPWK